ncbi:hypothetical protein EalM132_00159 [Exiguobacterium phage vB_EalM-132]|nr:hypothetical protein EalM132_00159 [Exiguobacterium phage vB_EalM-132]
MVDFLVWALDFATIAAYLFFIVFVIWMTFAVSDLSVNIKITEYEKSVPVVERIKDSVWVILVGGIFILILTVSIFGG